MGGDAVNAAVAIDGAGYVGACDELYSGNHTVFDALNALSEVLVGCFGMAGGDQSGQAWSRPYDQAAQRLFDGASALCDVFAHAANLTNTSLSNHDAADGGSIYAQYVPSLPPPDPNPAHCTEGLAMGLVSATGATSDPDWWHWVAAHMEGWFWPNADTDRLRDAGSAWKTAGRAIESAGTYAVGAEAALRTERSPEIATAVKALNALNRHCMDLGASFIDMGQACHDYAQLVDTLHQNVHDELESFWEWAVAVEVGGGVTAFFTAGLSEAPAQAVLATECANAARRVLGLIKALLAAVKESELVQAILARLAKIFPKLEKFLTSERQVAGLERAAVLVDETESSVEHLPELGDGWRATSFGDSASSFEYHYTKHGAEAGVTRDEYARDAQDWARHPAGTGRQVELQDGTEGIRYRTPGGGPGGILDLNQDIITFWYR